MTQTTASAAIPTADASLVTYTNVMYGLHAFGVVMGVLSTATTVVGGFVFGLPSLIAVVMNYMKRSEARGTSLEPHFTWQLRTFWFAVLWGVVLGTVSLALAVILIGFVTWYVGALVLGAWIIYRVARGWLALQENRSPAA